MSYFQTRYTFDKRRSFVWKQIVRYLTKYIDSAQPVLDLGAGYGDFINHVQSEDRWALDLDPAIQGHVQADITTIIGSVLAKDVDKTVPDNHFGTVFVSNFLEHFTVEQVQVILPWILKKLTPGGRLIVLQPNFKYAYQDFFDDYTHRSMLTEMSLANLMDSAGFGIEKVVPRFLPFSFKSSVSRGFWLIGFYLRSPWKPLAKQMLLIGSKPRS